MSLLRIPFLHHDSNLDDEEIRDVAEILEAGRPPRRAENLRFTVKTRGKSPASLFGRDHQLCEAVLHCVVTDTPLTERM
jgi:hypothetical protein